jgi:hypothetical protein
MEKLLMQKFNMFKPSDICGGETWAREVLSHQGDSELATSGWSDRSYCWNNRFVGHSV